METMTMLLKDIPRVRAGTSAVAGGKSLSEIDQERLYLATRAKDLLGYGVLTRHVTGEQRIGVMEGKLTETMLKLDLPILDTGAVIEYQLDMMTKLNREFIINNLESWAGSGWRTSVASWEKTELKAYELAVPEFVLDKAVKIAESLPEVNFYVQHLSDPKADPFLVATHGKEVYYIEAWDEPGFEDKL
jgi:hypothetical protein